MNYTKRARVIVPHSVRELVKHAEATGPVNNGSVGLLQIDFDKGTYGAGNGYMLSQVHDSSLKRWNRNDVVDVAVDDIAEYLQEDVCEFLIGTSDIVVVCNNNYHDEVTVELVGVDRADTPVISDFVFSDVPTFFASLDAAQIIQLADHLKADMQDETALRSGGKYDGGIVEMRTYRTDGPVEFRFNDRHGRLVEIGMGTLDVQAVEGWIGDPPENMRSVVGVRSMVNANANELNRYAARLAEAQKGSKIKK